mmetsp:Transcript_27355/g.67500  ORF Transcript_27355/g.67500 Transcript_27355/m.67500 type:complete len:302 (-) Transcript_27355:117-1022(-)
MDEHIDPGQNLGEGDGDGGTLLSLHVDEVADVHEHVPVDGRLPLPDEEGVPCNLRPLLLQGLEGAHVCTRDVGNRDPIPCVLRLPESGRVEGLLNLVKDGVVSRAVDGCGAEGHCLKPCSISLEHKLLRSHLGFGVVVEGGVGVGGVASHIDVAGGGGGGGGVQGDGEGGCVDEASHSHLLARCDHAPCALNVHGQEVLEAGADEALDPRHVQHGPHAPPRHGALEVPLVDKRPDDVEHPLNPLPLGRGPRIEGDDGPPPRPAARRQVLEHAPPHEARPPRDEDAWGSSPCGGGEGADLLV